MVAYSKAGTKSYSKLRPRRKVFEVFEIIEVFAKRMTVPVIVVFTQYDTLIASMEKDIEIVDGMLEEKILQLCNERAEAIFQRDCVEPLKRLNEQPGFSVTLQWARTSGDDFLTACVVR